jgi:hypothetical protein
MSRARFFFNQGNDSDTRRLQTDIRDDVYCISTQEYCAYGEVK